MSFSDIKWALIIVISRIFFSYHQGKSIFYRYRQSLDIKELPHNFEHVLKRKKREKAEQGTEAAAIFCCLSTCHIFFPSDVFIISYTDQRKAMQPQDKKISGIFSILAFEVFAILRYSAEINQLNVWLSSFPAYSICFDCSYLFWGSQWFPRCMFKWWCLRFSKCLGHHCSGLTS